MKLLQAERQPTVVVVPDQAGPPVRIHATSGNARRRPDDPLVELVVPVYNEERVLASSIWRLRTYLDRSFPFPASITIVDNASTDATAEIAAWLASELEGVRWVHLERKGRGRALRAAWSASEARVVAYMDVDLSTSLEALLPLVAPLLSGHSALSIGSRLAAGAHVERSKKRELISRGYNLLLKLLLRSTFSDAQCGFKAVRSDVVRRILPSVGDEGWFFDTELLVRAQRLGLRIHEVPVDWVEDRDSRVDIVSTVKGDLRGIARLLLERIDRTSCEPSSREAAARVGLSPLSGAHEVAS